MAGEERIKYLADAVRYHRELYYNHSAPEISDAEFDSLWDELKTLDPNNAVLHEVGPEPLPGTVKVEHMFPMRSLDKGTSDEDIIHFVTQSTFGGKRYLAQPKLDGSALSLEYVAGNLHRAATRGSGERGEDVTLNAKLVANVPTRLNIAIDCHVRGEVVMPLAVFEEKYRDVSPNPRNLCSGAYYKDIAARRAGPRNEACFRCLLHWCIFHHRYPARRRQLVEIHAHGGRGRCRHGDGADCAWHLVTDEHLLPARPGGPRLLQAENQRGQDHLASVDSMAAGYDRGALHRTVFLR